MTKCAYPAWRFKYGFSYRALSHATWVGHCIWLVTLCSITHKWRTPVNRAIIIVITIIMIIINSSTISLSRIAGCLREHSKSGNIRESPHWKRPLRSAGSPANSFNARSSVERVCVVAWRADRRFGFVCRFPPESPSVSRFCICPPKVLIWNTVLLLPFIYNIIKLKQHLIFLKK